jgi:hypothetical protein
MQSAVVRLIFARNLQRSVVKTWKFLPEVSSIQQKLPTLVRCVASYHSSTDLKASAGVKPAAGESLTALQL